MTQISHDFIYIIPIENDESMEFSPFQGYSQGFLHAVNFVATVLCLPANLLELSIERDKAIAIRMCGGSGHKILPIEKRYLKDMQFDWHNPFLCIFSLEETRKEVRSFIDNTDQPVLHISNKNIDDALHISEVSRDVFWEFFKKVKNYLEKNAPPESLFYINEYSTQYVKWEEKLLDFKATNHLVTTPNLLTLNSFNYLIKNNPDFKPAQENQYYIDEIRKTAKSIINERNRIAKSEVSFWYPPGCSLILTSQSIYLHLYKKKVYIKKHKNKAQARDFSIALKQIQRQTGYFHSLELKDQDANILESKPFQLAMSMRVDETNAYIAGVAVKACSNFAPTLRLPPLMNILRVDLQRLGENSRKNIKNKTYKINKIFTRISKKLRESIPDEFIELITAQHNFIKIIADVPLEWLPVNNIPLMIRYDTSRIPVTPGNLGFLMSCNNTKIHLTQKDFKEILIIRSLKDGDPIKEILKVSIDSVLSHHKGTSVSESLKADPAIGEFFREIEKTTDTEDEFRINIKWVDVETEEELINAMNDYHGPIMIFDGHGLHQKGEDYGSLVIGDTFVDMWKLKEIVNIPPIVILTACDTHPIDASHASTANGFLNAGALTVLGTLLPVDSIVAGLFIARLILRMEMFIPLAIKAFGGSIRWTSIISGLQRMMYVSELLNNLALNGVIPRSADIHKRIQFKSNNYINSFYPYWFEALLEEIEGETGVTQDTIKKFISNWNQLPDCLKYIQLGNSDNILIISDEMDTNLQKAL